MHIARYKSVLVPRDCSKLIDPKKQEYVPEKNVNLTFFDEYENVFPVLT